MKSRNRFLNTVFKNDRLDVAVDVWVSVLCGMLDAAASPHLPPPPTLQPLSIIIYKVAPVPETLRSRVLPLSATKHCIAGFLCCIADGSTECVPWRCNFFV